MLFITHQIALQRCEFLVFLHLPNSIHLQLHLNFLIQRFNLNQVHRLLYLNLLFSLDFFIYQQPNFLTKQIIHQKATSIGQSS